MAGILIACKFAILRHSPSGMRILGLVGGIGAVGFTWWIALDAGSDSARSDVLMLALAVWGMGWLLGPMLTNGTGVLRSEYFALLPIDRRRLGVLLLTVVFAGVGPVLTLLALAALGVHAAALDPAALVVAVPSMILLLVFVVTLSRLLFRALGAAMHSALGVEVAAVQYGLMLSAMFTGWFAINTAIQAVGSVVEEGLPAGPAAAGLAALPTSWPVLAIEAGAAGQWGAAVGWLGALAVLTAALVAAAAVLLAPGTRGRGVRRGGRPIGARPVTAAGSAVRLLPATPLGAVVGKEVRQWWRDPWRGLEVRTSLWTGIFAGLFMLSGGFGQAAPFAGVIAAFTMGLAAANLYGQDGTALWQTVVGQGGGTLRADIRGRQVAILLLIAPPAVAISAAFILVTGQHWAWPMVLAGLAVLLGVGSGVAVLLSVVAVSPGVDPHLRVDPNDAGDVNFQVWVALVGLQVLSLPTVGVVAWTWGTGGAWLAVLVGLANGLLVAWVLGRIAYRRLEARLPETFTRIRYGKAIAAQAAPEGGSWLDWLERGAIHTNTERKPVGS